MIYHKIIKLFILINIAFKKCYSRILIWNVTQKVRGKSSVQFLFSLYLHFLFFEMPFIYFFNISKPHLLFCLSSSNLFWLPLTAIFLKSFFFSSTSPTSIRWLISLLWSHFHYLVRISPIPWLSLFLLQINNQQFIYFFWILLLIFLAFGSICRGIYCW